MAIRSTGGTGVLVALVVFVLTTVFLLVMTIVFYSGKDKATVKMNEAEAKLAEFITASQRGDDAARALQAAATNERDSVFGYLVKRKADVAEFVTGDRAAELPTMRSVLGVPENSNLKDHLADVRRQVKSKTDESAGLATQLAEAKRQRERRTRRRKPRRSAPRSRPTAPPPTTSATRSPRPVPPSSGPRRIARPATSPRSPRCRRRSTRSGPRSRSSRAVSPPCRPRST
jgi:hypothetical protein